MPMQLWYQVLGSHSILGAFIIHIESPLDNQHVLRNMHVPLLLPTSSQSTFLKVSCICQLLHIVMCRFTVVASSMLKKLHHDTIVSVRFGANPTATSMYIMSVRRGFQLHKLYGVDLRIKGRSHIHPRHPWHLFYNFEVSLALTVFVGWLCYTSLLSFICSTCLLHDNSLHVKVFVWITWPRYVRKSTS